MTLHETAYAKVNLALHVRARRADGYHELETLFAFADDGDRLSVQSSVTLSLEIVGPFANGLSMGEDNLVLRAATTLREHMGVTAGAAFVLDKRLPVASGIGGGSADAAAALRLVTCLWQLDISSEELTALAGTLGADVPACVASESCFGSGIGDNLVPFVGNNVKGSPIRLVTSLVPCPTGPVFAAWNGKDRGELALDRWFDGRNDLEDAAITLHPEIAETLTVLQATNPKLARMSGSGATCFALFDTHEQRDAAQAAVVATCPSWWTMASSLR